MSGTDQTNPAATSPGYLRRIFSNIGWLSFERFFRLALSFSVGVIVARHLGPETFGKLNYAIAFFAILAPLAHLGSELIVVKELVRLPERAGETMGSALILQIGGAVLALLIVAVLALFSPVAAPGDRLVILVVGAGLLFQPSVVIKSWFESEVESRHVIRAEGLVLVLTAGIKITLVLTGAGLLSFALVFLLETGLIAIARIIAYLTKARRPQRWSPNWQRSRFLFRESWPLMFTLLAVMLYMRIDQIMIGRMLGNYSVGIYSLAMQFVEVGYAIPQILVTTLFPSIVALQLRDKERFVRRMEEFLAILVTIALLFSVAIALVAEPLISLIFGQAYADAAPIVVVYVWASVFVFVGTASGRWYIVEGLHKLALLRAVFGAIVNIALNLLLIPIYGLKGAAVATVISYVLHVMVFDAFFSRTRYMFRSKFKTLLLGPFIAARAARDLLRRSS